MKNKKILILLCIPLILAVMVLPLCSFTTLYGTTSFDRYSTTYNLCIPYNYYYSSSFYYGQLQECCSVLVDSAANTINQKNDSIKETASAYYITSSSRISIEDAFFTEDVNITNGMYNDVLDIRYTTNNSNTSFPSTIYIPEFLLSGSTDELLRLFYYKDGSLVSPNSSTTYSELDFSFDLSIVRVNPNNGELYVDEFTERGTIDFSDTWEILPLLWLNNYVRYNYDLNSYVVSVYLSNITFDLWIRDIETDNRIEDFDTVRVCGSTYKTSGSRSLYSDLIRSLDEYSLKSFNEGVNVGISQAPDVWGSISNFLTTTIGGFLNFEFVENISFGSIFAVFISIGLLIAFLKIFAGG